MRGTKRRRLGRRMVIRSPDGQAQASGSSPRRRRVVRLITFTRPYLAAQRNDRIIPEKRSSNHVHHMIAEPKSLHLARVIQNPSLLLASDSATEKYKIFHFLAVLYGSGMVNVRLWIMWLLSRINFHQRLHQSRPNNSRDSHSENAG